MVNQNFFSVIKILSLKKRYTKMKTAQTNLAIALPAPKHKSASVEDVQGEVKNPTIRIHKRWLWVFIIVWLAFKVTLILFLFYKKEYNQLSRQVQQATPATASNTQ